jgi:hypothetical protein
VQTNTLKSTTRNLGDSLSRFGNINFLIGDSPEDLQRMLREIRIPFQIVSMYAQGTKHLAWINSDIPVIKQQKNKG